MLTTREILLSSKNSAEAMAQLYAIGKAKNPQLSYSLLCQQTGIPSRGLWSDVQSGRRTLALRYIEPVARFFELLPFERDFFQLMVLRDRASSTEERRTLRHQFKKLEKILTATSDAQAPPDQGLDLFALKVFCLLGTFPEPPSAADIIARFAKDRRPQVLRALRDLEDVNYIASVDGVYHATEESRMFSDRGDDGGLQAFVKSCIVDASEQVDRWFSAPDQSHFQSAILSVKTAAIPKVIADTRLLLFEKLAELESAEGDTIVHLNFQLYPGDS